jgi:hypothetical protein
VEEGRREEGKVRGEKGGTFVQSNHTQFKALFVLYNTKSTLYENVEQSE